LAGDVQRTTVTIPAALSIASATVGLLAALLALGMSSAPGWRELRWFAACATFAALFNLVNAPINTSHAEPSILVLGTRLNLFFGGLHALTWIKYNAASEKRPLSRFERWWVAGGLLLSSMTLVPGLIVHNHVEVRSVDFFDIQYADAPPTSLGLFAIAFYEASLGVSLVRAFARRRRGDRTATAHVVALTAVLLGGAHDALAATGVLRDPYVLDLGLLALVLAVGGSITSRFVASARALELSSQKLAAAQRELVEKERLAALGELAAVVAHEVRNPLAVVFNATAGLRRARVEQTDHDALVAIVQEEAERLRDIVSDLLEFARPRPAVVDEVSAAELVRSAVETARSVASVGPGEVSLEMTSDLDRMTCDERLVRQAVVNLVTNALQAEGRRSPVRVFLRLERDKTEMMVVRVEDDGAGIGEEIRDRIFTPFFSTRPKGTGLGLAVVQRCAEAHHGTISVHATPGGGATFELRIPRWGLE
jgi:two-component system sensor histidine kinase HydH